LAEGRETRAAIDSETVRGLLLINGGGAVALLAFLSGIIEKPDLEVLARAVIWSVFAFQIGLACAVIHNRFRRLCSLEFSKKAENRKKCTLFGRESTQPCICLWSVGFMWASIISFLSGGILVLCAGLQILD
jgi:hypothetical protein